MTKFNFSKKIGIYSGTFDPVHKGHIALAIASIKNIGLDKVYILPEKTPWNKQLPLALELRTMLLKEAIKNEVKVEVLHIDQDRFTVDRTLPILLNTFKGDELYFIFGSDIFISMSLHIWDGMAVLLKQSSIIVGYRNPHELAEIETAADMLTKKTGVKVNYSVVHDTLPDISSTVVREALRKGHSVESLMPKEAADIAISESYYK